MELGGENWLIPVDAELKTDRDLLSEAIGLKTILQSVSRAGALGLVILDSCRDNPFAAKMARTNKLTRSVDRGLARVEPTANVLVAYAAKDGTTATDGDGRNSPYTAALLRHLGTRGLEVSFWTQNRSRNACGPGAIWGRGGAGCPRPELYNQPRLVERQRWLPVARS